LKFIFVVPVIFKLDDVEPIKEFVLVKDANILIPETVNDDITEILSDVILFASMSFKPVEDNPQHSI
jgi:hypothetical protein